MSNRVVMQVASYACELDELLDDCVLELDEVDEVDWNAVDSVEDELGDDVLDVLVDWNAEDDVELVELVLEL